MADALHRDNDELLRRALNAERDYAAVVRINDSYREELIELRIRVCGRHSQRLRLAQ